LGSEIKGRAELDHGQPLPVRGLGENIMDKDRIEGSAKKIRGKIKEVAGKVRGDAKLESEGKADQAAGKVQNAVGGLKDYLKGE
jgi:uncharacterized protein YjbJ (UPF0337 family)